MEKLSAILFISLPVLFFAGCDKPDNVFSTQQQQMQTFLKNTHVPKLIPESDIPFSVVQNPEFYTEMGDVAYRYIRDYYNPDREAQPLVNAGDVVSLTFNAFVFTNQVIDTAKMKSIPYFSNDPLLKRGLESVGLKTEYWSFEPIEIVAGGGQIIDGADISLHGCREKDTVEVYMTYTMAYGSNVIGTVPKQSPVAFFYIINEVKKQ